MIRLSPALNKLDEKTAFEQLMHLDGKLYRKQAGRKTLQISIEGKLYFIKRYEKDFFKIGAKNEWMALQTCEKLGIASPKLYGFGYRGRQSFVLMESIDHTGSLEDFVLRKDHLSFSEKRSYIAQVAEIARKLHTQGYFHRDFYLCHFLYQKEARKIYLIDLHRVFKPIFFKQRWQEKDLAGLLFSALDFNVTRNDVFYFLKQYFQEDLSIVLQKNKIFLETIYQKANALYQKKNGNAPSRCIFQSLVYWPESVGPFQKTIKIGKQYFMSQKALRVLSGKRVVLLGTLENQWGVAKFFLREKDFSKENQGYALLEKTGFSIPKCMWTAKEKDFYAMVFEFIDGKPLKQMTTDLISAIAQMHNAGIMQSDPHLDNALLCDEKIIWIDFGTIQAVLRPEKLLKNLAQWYAQFPPETDIQHLTYLDYYCNIRKIHKTPQWTEEFMRLIKQERKQRLKKWTEKIFRNCTQFLVKKRHYGNLYVDKACLNDYTWNLIKDPDDYLADKKIICGNQQFFMKVFPLKSIRDCIQSIMKGSSAKRAWRNIHQARLLGIDTPKPLILIEKSFCYFPVKSYLVTEWIEGENLDRFL